MKSLKVGFATDHAELEKWTASIAEYDPNIIKYPTHRVLIAYNGKGNVVYLPSQVVLMLESAIPNPEASDLDRAQALRDIVKAYEVIASGTGIKEIYFLCTDDKVYKIAAKHGFEEVPWPVLRMRL